jgi:hypothetical protein
VAMGLLPMRLTGSLPAQALPALDDLGAGCVIGYLIKRSEQPKAAT